MAYKKLKHTVYYYIVHTKEKVINRIINKLFKYTDRHLFKSVTIHHTTNTCYGKKYYIIDSEPHPVIYCDYMNK